MHPSGVAASVAYGSCVCGNVSLSEQAQSRRHGRRKRVLMA